MAIEWGGISRFADELCAALFDDSSDLTSQQVATIELRKALEPLLEAAQNCAQMTQEPGRTLARARMREELTKWR